MLQVREMVKSHFLEACEKGLPVRFWQLILYQMSDKEFHLFEISTKNQDNELFQTLISTLKSSNSSSPEVDAYKRFTMCCFTQLVGHYLKAPQEIVKEIQKATQEAITESFKVGDDLSKSYNLLKQQYQKQVSWISILNQTIVSNGSKKDTARCGFTGGRLPWKSGRRYLLHTCGDCSRIKQQFKCKSSQRMDLSSREEGRHKEDA